VQFYALPGKNEACRRLTYGLIFSGAAWLDFHSRIGNAGRAMMQRRRVFFLLASAAIGGANALQASPTGGQEHCSQAHVAWVTEVLTRMQTIKPGMTRRTLLTVFTIEGGLSTGLRRTFVSRDCPYFKIDVQFQAVGRPDRDENGRVTLVEGNEDIILKVSIPYLQFSVMD
jgi:hypothetical protein